MEGLARSAAAPSQPHAIAARIGSPANLVTPLMPFWRLLLGLRPGSVRLVLTCPATGPNINASACGEPAAAAAG
jgi:hypothetical protein